MFVYEKKKKKKPITPASFVKLCMIKRTVQEFSHRLLQSGFPRGLVEQNDSNAIPFPKRHTYTVSLHGITDVGTDRNGHLFAKDQLGSYMGP